jgi:predicted RNA-binding protein (virulence factor B family)
VKIGKTTTLVINRFTDPGAYLVDDEGNDVLLPNKYLTSSLQEEQEIDVFLYKDSEDRIVATTETPFLQLGEFAYLKVVDVNAFGAFVDWGLEKHLLIPFKEQMATMELGGYYLITLQHDELTDRLFGSAKIKKYIEPCDDQMLMGHEVNLLIADRTPLGVKVIVNNLFQGIIFRSDINRLLKRGEKCTGYVSQVRDDGKLDIRLEKVSPEKYDDAALHIMQLLNEKKELPFSDKSDPDDIREFFGMSKKTFKQAIGKLYKDRKVELTETSIRIVED